MNWEERTRFSACEGPLQRPRVQVGEYRSVVTAKIEAVAKDLVYAEKKSRDAHIQSVVQVHDAISILMAMSSNGALGSQAAVFLSTVLNHVKRSSTFRICALP